MREYECFERIGVEPHRSYYIPFAENDEVKTHYGITDRNASSRFLLLDGTWEIKQHESVSDVVVDEVLTETIPVPSCLQMHGYDKIQYLNCRYPFPVMIPHVPTKCSHATIKDLSWCS